MMYDISKVLYQTAKANQPQISVSLSENLQSYRTLCVALFLTFESDTVICFGIVNTPRSNVSVCFWFEIIRYRSPLRSNIGLPPWPLPIFIWSNIKIQDHAKRTAEMIDPKTIQEIQDAPVDERIRLIEQIRQSLKQDMLSTQPKTKEKFTVRAFNLGSEVHVNRKG
jgi:hypothetical protein